MSDMITPGCILIAHPLIGDENFVQSVILIVSHDNVDGSVGFVLNQETALTLSDAMDGEWPKIQLRKGGPIELDALYYLHRSPVLIPDGQRIDNQLYWGGNFQAMHQALMSGKLHANNIKCFVGYSGWGVDQLQEEINEESWSVLPPNTVDCLDEWENLWQQMMLHLPPAVRLWKDSPILPEWN